jgi:hypothetical protein
MIVWLNGTHGVGKTTTSALLQQLIPDSRVFDAEKVGETLMDITPGLPGSPEHVLEGQARLPRWIMKYLGVQADSCDTRADPDDRQVTAVAAVHW